jgi:hypothetical protein
VKTYPFKNPPPGGGKAKGSASMTEKLQHNTVDLFFMTRYAPDSGFFFMLQISTRERYREGENISLQKSSS